MSLSNVTNMFESVIGAGLYIYALLFLLKSVMIH